MDPTKPSRDRETTESSIWTIVYGGADPFLPKRSVKLSLDDGIWRLSVGLPDDPIWVIQPGVLAKTGNVWEGELELDLDKPPWFLSMTETRTPSQTAYLYGLLLRPGSSGGGFAQESGTWAAEEENPDPPRSVAETERRT